MIYGQKWGTVKVIDKNGAVIGECRVPQTERAPGVIMWGNRYFTLGLSGASYRETTFFLVPIERMYPPNSEQLRPRGE